MNLNWISWFCCGRLGSRGWFFFNIIVIFPIIIILFWFFFLFRLILCKNCPWVESRPYWRNIRSWSWSEPFYNRSFILRSEWSRDMCRSNSFNNRLRSESLNDGLRGESLNNWSLSHNWCWSHSLDNWFDWSRSLPNLLRSGSCNSC